MLNNQMSITQSSSGSIDPNDLLFVKVANGNLIETVQGFDFSVANSATLENDYVTCSGSGSVTSDSSISLSANVLTFGLWIKAESMSIVTEPISLHVSDFHGLTTVRMRINYKDESLSIPLVFWPTFTVNSSLWYFIVCECDCNAGEYGQGHWRLGNNGSWTFPGETSFSVPLYAIRETSINLSNIISIDSNSNFTGLFLTESYPDWDVLEEYASASKPADATMW